MALIEFTEDDNYLYANGTGFTPNREVYCTVVSTPVDPNPSTEGITAGMHKTSNSSGVVKFKMPKAFILEDLPRSVKADATVSPDTASVEETFTA